MITGLVYTGDLVTSIELSVSAITGGVIVGIACWVVTLVGHRNFERGGNDEL